MDPKPASRRPADPHQPRTYINPRDRVLVIKSEQRRYNVLAPTESPAHSVELVSSTDKDADVSSGSDYTSSYEEEDDFERSCTPHFLQFPETNPTAEGEGAASSATQPDDHDATLHGASLASLQPGLSVLTGWTGAQFVEAHNMEPFPSSRYRTFDSASLGLRSPAASGRSLKNNTVWLHRSRDSKLGEQRQQQQQQQQQDRRGSETSSYPDVDAIAAGRRSHLPRPEVASPRYASPTAAPPSGTRRKTTSPLSPVDPPPDALTLQNLEKLLSTPAPTELHLHHSPAGAGRDVVLHRRPPPTVGHRKARAMTTAARTAALQQAPAPAQPDTAASRLHAKVSVQGGGGGTVISTATTTAAPPPPSVHSHAVPAAPANQKQRNTPTTTATSAKAQTANTNAVTGTSPAPVYAPEKPQTRQPQQRGPLGAVTAITTADSPAPLPMPARNHAEPSHPPLPVPATATFVGPAVAGGLVVSPISPVLRVLARPAAAVTTQSAAATTAAVSAPRFTVRLSAATKCSAALAAASPTDAGFLASSDSPQLRPQQPGIPFTEATAALGRACAPSVDSDRRSVASMKTLTPAQANNRLQHASPVSNPASPIPLSLQSTDLTPTTAPVTKPHAGKIIEAEKTVKSVPTAPLPAKQSVAPQPSFIPRQHSANAATASATATRRGSVPPLPVAFSPNPKSGPASRAQRTASSAAPKVQPAATGSTKTITTATTPAATPDSGPGAGREAAQRTDAPSKTAHHTTHPKMPSAQVPGGGASPSPPSANAPATATAATLPASFVPAVEPLGSDVKVKLTAVPAASAIATTTTTITAKVVDAALQQATEEVIAVKLLQARKDTTALLEKKRAQLLTTTTTAVTVKGAESRNPSAGARGTAGTQRTMTMRGTVAPPAGAEFPPSLVIPQEAQQQAAAPLLSTGRPIKSLTPSPRTLEMELASAPRKKVMQETVEASPSSTAPAPPGAKSLTAKQMTSAGPGTSVAPSLTCKPASTRSDILTTSEAVDTTLPPINSNAFPGVPHGAAPAKATIVTDLASTGRSGSPGGAARRNPARGRMRPRKRHHPQMIITDLSLLGMDVVHEVSTNSGVLCRSGSSNHSIFAATRSNTIMDGVNDDSNQHEQQQVRRLSNVDNKSVDSEGTLSRGYSGARKGSRRVELPLVQRPSEGLSEEGRNRQPSRRGGTTFCEGV